jgi:hypothetical protein
MPQYDFVTLFVIARSRDLGRLRVIRTRERFSLTVRILDPILGI